MRVFMGCGVWVDDDDVCIMFQFLFSLFGNTRLREQGKSLSKSATFYFEKGLLCDARALTTNSSNVPARAHRHGASN